MRWFGESPWTCTWQPIKSSVTGDAVIMNVKIYFGEFQWLFKVNHHQPCSSRRWLSGFLWQGGRRKQTAGWLQRGNMILFGLLFACVFHTCFLGGFGTQRLAKTWRQVKYVVESPQQSQQMWNQISHLLWSVWTARTAAVLLFFISNKRVSSLLP